MKLNFQPLAQNIDLVPAQLLVNAKTLDDFQAIKVAEIAPANADGDKLSQAYDIPYDMEVNCLVVEVRRGDTVKYAALLVPYGKRANTASPTKRALDSSKVSFIDLELVTEATQMMFGAIITIGLPSDYQVLYDPILLEQEKLVVGGGFVHSKLLIPSRIL